MNTLRNQSVLVIGLGETGLSLARYLHAQGARLRVADSRMEPPGAATLRSELPQVELHCGTFTDELLQGIDRIAISPGVPLTEPVVQHAIARGIPVEGDIELLAQEIANKFPDMHERSLTPTLSQKGRGGDREKRPLILAITGSNGKTTVTAMVEHLCRAAGKDVLAAGNISPAVLDAVMQRGAKQPEIWVLELSSFQLETTASLNADAATVLNVSEDHLDRYADMNAYAAAKARIFAGNGTQSRHGAAEPCGSGFNPTRRDFSRVGLKSDPLLPQTAGFASNVSEVQSRHGAAEPCGSGFNPTRRDFSRVGLKSDPHLPQSAGYASNVSGVQILNRDDPRSMAMVIEGRKQITFGLNPPPVSTAWDGVEHDLNETTGDFGIERHAGAIWLVQGSERLLRADELQVSGLHNVANALAALALCRAIGLPMHKLLGALRGFKGLPHRMQRVAEIAGITYYDDSKGTNVGATVAALQGLGKPAVVIFGGEGKGQDFSPLREAVALHARAAVLIGRDAPLIAQAISGCGKPVLHARDMEDAVCVATEQAQNGDAVLLSPACASFDMFHNYAHRAEVFVQAVHKLMEATV